MCKSSSMPTAGLREQPDVSAASDRILAGKLQQQGVPLTVVENALVLAAARRLFRAPEALPLRTIRSLHYFLPIIQEVLELRVAQGYFQHLRNKIERSIKK